MCDFYFAGFISKLFKGYLREACFPPSSYARCLLFLKASSPVKLLHWTLLHQPPSNPLSHIYSRCSPISLAFVRALHSHKSATARWIIYHPSLVLLLSSRCHYNYYAFYTRGFKAKREKKNKKEEGGHWSIRVHYLPFWVGKQRRGTRDHTRIFRVLLVMEFFCTSAPVSLYWQNWTA